MIHVYRIESGPKGLQESCNMALALMGNTKDPNKEIWMGPLRQLLRECERKRPTGPDGKHNDRHTDECGCEDMLL